MKKLVVIVLCLSIVTSTFAIGFDYTVSNNRLTFVNKVNQLTFLTINLEKPFLSAAKQTVNTKYKYAAFSFKTKVNEQFMLKEKPEIIISNDTLLLKGFLHSKQHTVSYQLSFYTDENYALHWQAMVSDSGINFINLIFESTSTEQFFGFGEQFSYLNFKGKKFPVFSEEQGIGRGDAPVSFFTNLAGVKGNAYTTYCAIPFTITTRNRAMLIHNTEYIEFDLKKNEELSFSVNSNSVSGILWTDYTPKKLIEKYTEHSGRMPKLPNWAFGSWLGLQGGIEKVETIVDDALKAKNPVTAVWIQDWVGKRETKIGSRLYWNWLPDTVSYPNIKNFTARMNEKGIQVLGYINPFLAEYGPLTNEAIAKNYLVKNKEGKDYLIAAGGFDAYMVDLSNPEAVVWMKTIIKNNLIGNGFSGWMADFSEWLPFDAVLHSGKNAATYHNQYMVDWARINREAIQEADKEGEIIFFNRAGFTGSAKHSTLFWEGDQMVSWQKHDGLPSALNGLLSSGLSGISLNHSDIGGYTSVKRFPVKYIRSKELFFRWAEMNIFSPIFRTHEGLLPKDNFQFYNDSSSQVLFAKMARLHFALKPYFQFLNKEAYALGYPIVRTCYFVFPKDEKTLPYEKQFMLGDDMLIMPVLKKKQNQVKGYLPKGNWVYAWNNKEFSGGKEITIEAPLGQPAVFIKKDSKWSDFFNKTFSNHQ
jgi:sulfoquinovosidase